ncbi:hypothetical protein PS2015_2412 [Pseudohongiella spirulinae]|uniref:ABC transporter domain-containing protein n=2 Tax=Pseudohongiella spirulinae TaxID=1249552 RepID=A0A0S2KFD7_9GAMM|nr:hypothetical protein PS2015_2412 [Pseudohongiella spirulinae]
MTASPLFEIRGLNCRISARHQLVVDSFKVEPGQHWCLFGGNGAGKSLLASLFSGRLMLARSRIQYATGFDPLHDIQVVSFEEQQRLWQSETRHDVSEFSESASDPGTTVAKLVTGRDTDDCLAGEFLQRLDIKNLADRGIRFLSSGQIRRAMIAKALYQKPKLLILDDPLASIDRQSAESIREILNQYVQADNAMILLARRQQDILTSATHIAVMDSLKLISSGERYVVEQLAAFRHIVNRQALVPENLPALDERLPGVMNYRRADRTQALIKLDSVTAQYGSKVVFRNFSWQMDWGDHVLIEGPNGSGKSTLLGLINGDNHMAYGQAVTVFGQRRGSGESVWDIKQRFGVVSNELHNRYIKGWRVLDVVVSGFFDTMGLYENTTAIQQESARQWLQAFGLVGQGSCWYHELSFGQQRMVLLARAMVKWPLILILDEPGVGLDDYYSDFLMAILEKIVHSGRTHIIYVSHTFDETPQFINKRLSMS